MDIKSHGTSKLPQKHRCNGWKINDGELKIKSIPKAPISKLKKEGLWVKEQAKHQKKSDIKVEKVG